jgi:hypothetical protein
LWSCSSLTRLLTERVPLVSLFPCLWFDRHLRRSNLQPFGSVGRSGGARRRGRCVGASASGGQEKPKPHRDDVGREIFAKPNGQSRPSRERRHHDDDTASVGHGLDVFAAVVGQNAQSKKQSWHCDELVGVVGGGGGGGNVEEIIHKILHR